ncbi:hypothetical protein F4808DRAFT_459232 [Astrocystis sublimbata]|nr:hypothetical protein F4808DRAFT_459232 [Astrocystis sublimbata]
MDMFFGGSGPKDIPISEPTNVKVATAGAADATDADTTADADVAVAVAVPPPLPSTSLLPPPPFAPRALLLPPPPFSLDAHPLYLSVRTPISPLLSPTPTIVCVDNEPTDDRIVGAANEVEVVFDSDAETDHGGAILIDEERPDNDADSGIRRSSPPEAWPPPEEVLSDEYIDWYLQQDFVVQDPKNHLALVLVRESDASLPDDEDEVEGDAAVPLPSMGGEHAATIRVGPDDYYVRKIGDAIAKEYWFYRNVFCDPYLRDCRNKGDDHDQDQDQDQDYEIEHSDKHGQEHDQEHGGEHEQASGSRKGPRKRARAVTDAGVVENSRSFPELFAMGLE